MNFFNMLFLSRPRFRIYELGSFILGVVAGGMPLDIQGVILVGIFFLYFAFPANLLIYGVNDIYDYDTDKLNPKKVEYELLLLPRHHKQVWKMIALFNIPFLFALFFVNMQTVIAFLLFLFFAIQYSAYPIRAKIRPILDSIFSASHYVVTGVFGFLLVSSGSNLEPVLIIAAIDWAIAMHAYSAIPDIKADSEAGISTVATLLGKQYTLIFCGFLYFMAAYLSFAFLGRPVVLFGGLYCFIMFRSYQLKSLVTLYKYFPTINLLVGMFITFIVIYKNYIN